MNYIVPFTKDIDFKTSIGQITSISLEHEYNVNKDIILGNFIISGSYKTHELSVNTEDFSYTVPFDLSLTEDIDSDTVKLTIDNFVYEIVNSTFLKVDIDYKVEGKTIVKPKIVFEELPRETLEEIIDFDKLEEEQRVEEEKTLEREIEEEIMTTDIKEVSEENKNMIMSLGASKEESFVTYHVHVVKEGESAESISKLYNKSEIDVTNYNKLLTFVPGEKVIIPEDE